MTEATKQLLRSTAAAGNADAFAIVLDQVGLDHSMEVVEAINVLICPAGNLALVEAFLKRGFGVDARAKDGTSILMWAAYWGSLPIITQLLTAGADVNARDAEGRTPLIFAIDGQREEVVKHLLRAGADPTIQTVKGDSAMSLAESSATGYRLPFNIHLSLRRHAPNSRIARWLKEHVAGQGS